MSTNKKIVADTLFWLQIFFAFVFCGAYFYRSLHDVTGSSLVQFGLVATFTLLHLALSIGAHKSAPSRVTFQAIVIYCVWTVLMTTIIGAVILNPSYEWNQRETTQLSTALSLTFAIFLFSLFSGKGPSDPIIKALLAISYKSVPQVLLALKFLAEGASGTPGLSVLIGHVTIIIRLAQIGFMVKEAGWEKNRIWLAISETTNEVSWLFATIAWIAMN